MASNVYQANIVTENGDSFIPASQRPDGTWRKARRVKEGYVPQEEVPLYESKGKQFMNRKPEPVKLPTGQTAQRPIPGLFILDEKDKKQPKKKTKSKVDEITVQLQNTKVTEKSNKSIEKIAQKSSEKSSQAFTDSNKSDEIPLEKKLKNLKKKVREIEALEEKIANNQIAKPEPEQLVKVKRKNDLLVQIHQLEKQMK